jgi:hypothetical protein
MTDTTTKTREAAAAVVQGLDVFECLAPEDVTVLVTALADAGLLAPSTTAPARGVTVRGPSGFFSTTTNLATGDTWRRDLLGNLDVFDMVGEPVATFVARTWASVHHTLPTPDGQVTNPAGDDL